MIAALLFAALLVPTAGAIVWDTSHGQSPDRRLAVETVNSHTNATDPDCIVGGYDEDHPTRVYVGGPCDKISNGSPMAGFRYVVMETVDADLENKADGGIADVEAISGAEFRYAQDFASYAEVGAGTSVHFSNETITDAALFLSTTSYLSKADFTFSRNTFVVSKDGLFAEDICVKPCAGTPPQQCTNCPAQNSADAIQVNKGQYKYSILAAAYDNGAKGWSKVKETYKAPSGNLEGYLNVYQKVDFTNMNADTLTITGTSTSVKYADMAPCTMDTFKDAADPTKDCTIYSVASFTVESDGWNGSYAFPLTYNYGTWSHSSDTANVTASHEGTRTVIIHSVRASGTSKVIYLRYRFDVSGIDASGVTFPKTGKYMVYDPTVTTDTQQSAPGPAPGPVPSTTTSPAPAGASPSPSTTSPAPAGASPSPKSTASLARTACEPAVACFAMMVLAALGIFA